MNRDAAEWFLNVAVPAVRPEAELPPTTRAALSMALVAIALVGLFFVAAILLGGHWVRRQGNVRRGPAAPPDRPPLSTWVRSGRAAPDAGSRRQESGEGAAPEAGDGSTPGRNH